MSATATSHVSEAAINALFAVIYRLRDTPPLTPGAAQALREQARQSDAVDTLAETGLKADGDELLTQISRVDAGLDRWFTFGEKPSTYPVNQVAYLLRHSGKRELERAFLAVWRLHFRQDRVGTDAPDPPVRSRRAPEKRPAPPRLREPEARRQAAAPPAAPVQKAAPPPAAAPAPSIEPEPPAPETSAADAAPRIEPQPRIDPRSISRAPEPAARQPAQQPRHDPQPDFHSAIEAELFGDPEEAPDDETAVTAADGADHQGQDDDGLTMLGEALSGASGPPARKDANGTGEVTDYWRVPPVILMALGGVPPTNIALVPIQGDSMVPTLLDGDVAVIDTRHRLPSPDGIYALNDAFGGIVVKRLEVIANADDKFPMVQVISDNPKYEPRHLYLDEIQVVGRVLRKFGHVS
ncbi:hypothetical protein GCM10007989_22920 [Devosia pacifica]|uniref:Peptidase S24/S26A/S26B/S26C domain-containing protein n=1 Tax=Devosia pacifica TaxID=1335967 RepID=A0A918S8P1_9HYPH|nr:S24 family peptidase [Devosia pacifica]GHA26541.1 hypothetical protein GCM10007989_22920 [Devosia pacifica]